MSNYRVNFDDYSFLKEAGTFTAKVDHKMYGKKDNMLVNLTLEDGRKIVAVAYKDSDYLGLDNIEVDSFVEVTFTQSQSGLIRLSEINVVE